MLLNYSAVAESELLSAQQLSGNYTTAIKENSEEL